MDLPLATSEHPAFSKLLGLYGDAAFVWDGSPALQEFADAMRVSMQEYCDLYVLIRFKWPESIPELRDLCERAYMAKKEAP